LAQITHKSSRGEGQRCAVSFNVLTIKLASITARKTAWALMRNVGRLQGHSLDMLDMLIAAKDRNDAIMMAL